MSAQPWLYQSRPVYRIARTLLAAALLAGLAGCAVGLGVIVPTSDPIDLPGDIRTVDDLVQRYGRAGKDVRIRTRDDGSETWIVEPSSLSCGVFLVVHPADICRFSASGGVRSKALF